MASPGEISGLKTPAVRWIRRAPPLLPTACLSVAISALETELSAVATTRFAAVSTYQATPVTPDRSTALLTAESWLALYPCGDAAAPDGATNAPTAAAATATAN